MANKKDVKKMSEEEIKDWENLCNYVKYEILQYPKEFKFSKHLILRLKGLAEGTFISNKKQKPQANYSFKTILTTFKICKPKIRQYLENNESKIKDEQHKINLIMMFVEQEINDVVLRLQRAEKSNKKIENLSLDNQIYEGAEYRKKSTEKTAGRLEDLW